MIYRFYELPVWLSGLMIAALLLIAMEAGAWYGRKVARAGRGGAPRDGRKRSELEIGAMLALMGLVLAFTYSFSLSRMDQRKQAIIIEANAIGTAFLRADLLPEPARSELRERLLDYARTRILGDDAVRSFAKVREAIDRSRTAQSELWPATKRALQNEVPGHLQMLTVQAINEVLDADTRRMAAGFDRLSFGVLLLMLVLSALSVAFAAQAAARENTLSRTRITVFALVLSGLICLVVDFDNSSRGLIRVDQGSLTRLVAQMEAELRR